MFKIAKSQPPWNVWLGPIIDSCHVSIVLVKRFCKFVDSMLTTDNEIIKVIITKAIASAQSPIGMNITILRNTV